MSQDTTITIYHFDDEPETIDWIPDSLFNHYRLERPSWVEGEGSSEEDEEQVTTFKFNLNTPKQRITICYLIHRLPYTFEREFRPNPQDIVILDLIVERPGGGIEAKGLDFLDQACKHMKVDRIYIMTAFPGVIQKERPELFQGWPDGHLIIKPADAGALVQILANKLNPLMQDGL
jgi:hypothetical protein